jgi:nitrite reductase (NADH) small subunit
VPEANAGVEVGTVDAFPVDAFRVVAVDGREIGILRREDGTVHAVLNVCPHRRGPVCTGRYGGSWLPASPGGLVFGLAGRVLQCPWHGWEFDIETGDCLFGVSETRLLVFPAWVEGGTVRIELRPKRPRAAADPAPDAEVRQHSMPA